MLAVLPLFPLAGVQGPAQRPPTIAQREITPGDTLSVGGYDAGLRAVDSSGESPGDRGAEGPELMHVNTADMDGFVRDTAMTWGVAVRDGRAHVHDMDTGLWTIQMEPLHRSLAP